MNYIGDFPEDYTTVTVLFTTHDGNGAPVAPLTGFEAADVTIYKNGATAKATTNGVTMTSPLNSKTGLHAVIIDTSNDTGDSGFWTTGGGSVYSVVLDPDTETVNSQTVRKVIGSFGICVAPALRPTSAGRTLDVTATGAAGIDWGNVENLTTSNGLTGTTIATTQTISTVTNQLTAAQIAAGVWQDTTAGDFTVSASIGKSVMNGVALGTGLTVNDITTKTGYSLSQSFPSNFSSLGITLGGHITTVDTVTTVTNQLTAAAIATGVWTDTTAGDFTTSLSVGKSIMNGVTLGTGLTVAAVASGGIAAATFASGALDAVWSSAARTLTAGTNIQLPSNGLANVTSWTVAITGNITGNLSGSVGSVTGLTASDVGSIKTTIGTAGAGLTALGDTRITHLDADVSTRLPTTSYTAPDNATIAAIAGYVDTEVAAIKAKTDLIPGTSDGLTFAERLTLISAVLLGKASGLDTTTAVFRALDDSKARVTATVDTSGNRSAVTLDAA